MKVICDGLDLSDAVLKVSKALSVKAANPALEGIKITAKGDSLTLLATDLELTIERKIKADVLMEGETVVVGKYFVDFVKKLEKEQVELSRLYDAQLQIKYSDSESELQVYPVQSFPVIEKKEDEKEKKLADLRQEKSAFPGGAYTVFAPPQQGKAVLGFQRMHHAADAGGGVAQLLSRCGETAAFHGAEQYAVFFAVRAAPSFFDILSMIA